MDKIIIVAASENGVIGKDNDLPWPRIREDMIRFRDLTKGNPTIMGRKTYESIPENFRPLDQRPNIILSNQREMDLGFKTGYHEEKDALVTVYNNFEGALELAKRADSKGIYIAGGGEIYKQAIKLNLVDKIELTKIHANFEGDTFFPKVNFNEWEKTYESERKSTKSGLEYSFLTYIKK